MAIPGLRLHAFATRWFDAATVSRVFEPLIADWQREWIEASPAARAWIRLHGTIAFLVAALATTPRTVFMTPSPASVTRRVLSRIIIFTSVATVLTTLPFVSYMRELSWARSAAAALCILPSGIVLVFPFAMTWVADAIRRACTPTPAERIAVVRTGVVAVAFAVLAVGWVMPAANQAFREIVRPEWTPPPVRGTRELTLTELAFNAPAETLFGHPDNIRRELNQRIVIAVLPAILLWLRWGAHQARPKRRLFPLPVAVETLAGYILFYLVHSYSVDIEPSLGLEAGSGLWLIPVVFIAVGFLRTSLNRRLTESQS